MAEITRTSQATWFGDLKSGKGQMISESGEIKNQQYSYATRFEETPGTNPEELIAAAHAGCYAMAFSGYLVKKGYRPESIEVRAVCFLEASPAGGHHITRMSLDVLGKVPDIDEETFIQLAHEADKTCPVSNLLRSGLEIQIEPGLVKTTERQQK